MINFMGVISTRFWLGRNNQSVKRFHTRIRSRNALGGVRVVRLRRGVRTFADYALDHPNSAQRGSKMSAWADQIPGLTTIDEWCIVQSPLKITRGETFEATAMARKWLAARYNRPKLSDV
jgi:hypothetical protein